VGFLGKLLLGSGKLKPEMHAALESEGLVLIEEELSGSVRYTHFKAPGKRFHGKVTPERVGIGISRERVVVYCKGGRAKLIDSPFSSPNFDWVDVGLHGEDKVSFRIDYDRADVENVAGQVEIRVKTPSAERIVGELRARLGR
jgi:hypothetical protein